MAYSRLVSAMEQQQQRNSNNNDGESSSDSTPGNDGNNSTNNNNNTKKSSNFPPLTSGGTSKGKKKRNQRKSSSQQQPLLNGSTPATGGGSASSSHSTSSSSSLSFPPLPFPPELAAHYLATHASSGSSKGGNRVFGPTPPPPSMDDKKTNAAAATAALDLQALAQSGGINLADLGFDGASVGGSGGVGDSSSGSQTCSDAEMKALMSMFVEFMGMFSESDNPAGSGGGSSPSNPALSRENISKMNIAAAMAASEKNTPPNSAFPVFSMLFGAAGGELSPGGVIAKSFPGASAGSHHSSSSGAPPQSSDFNDAVTAWEDYVDDDDDGSDASDGSDLPELRQDGVAPDWGGGAGGSGNSSSSSCPTGPRPQDRTNGMISHDSRNNEESERARKAAKKREKKNRRKEKAKRDAAARAAQSAQRRREARITSWRSRVVTACSNGDKGKLDQLLADSPFSGNGGGGGEAESGEEDVTEHMEWLLPACVPKSYKGVGSQSERNARHKLALYVMTMSFSVIFQPVRNGRNDGRNALHVACQMGDVHFVKMVVDRKGAGKDQTTENLKKRLNFVCKDAGWSALHYAAASGAIDVVEVLLAGGSDVKILTDASLTSRISNNKGVKPQELATLLHTGQISQLNCKGRALQESIDIINLNSTLKKALEQIANRLSEIELKGYTPPSQPLISGTISNNDPPQTSSQSDPVPKIEEGKKKKRNRKKKSQQNQSATSTTTSNTASTSQPTNTNINSSSPSQKSSAPEDPLVSALLAMGFTNDQITAAAKACGGTERATADDLIGWIVEHESGKQSPSSASSSPAPAPSSTFHQHHHQSPVEFQRNVANLKAQQQQRLMAQAKKEANLQAEREKEAAAAAQRLAAKREEQRRINREWNNREKERQREEAQQKLVEEMERRKKVELEKQLAVKREKEQQRMAAAVAAGVNSRVGVTAYNNGSGVMVGNVAGGHYSGNAGLQHQQQQHHSPFGGNPAVNATPTSSFHTFSNDTVPASHQPPPPVHTHPMTQMSNIHHASNMMSDNSLSYPPVQMQPSHAQPSNMTTNPNLSTDYSNYPNATTTNNMMNWNEHENLTRSDAYSYDATVTTTEQQIPVSGNTAVKLAKNQSPPHLEVNAFEFPELGKNSPVPAPPPTTKTNPNQHKKGKHHNHHHHHHARNNNKTHLPNATPPPVTSDETPRSKVMHQHHHQHQHQQRGKQQPRHHHIHPKHQLPNKTSSANVNPHSPSKMQPSTTNTPPPGFKLTPTSTPPLTYESNPLGEIRATAKVFIPTRFQAPAATPQQQQQQPPQSKSTATPPPPSHSTVPTSQPSSTAAVPPGLEGLNTRATPFVAKTFYQSNVSSEKQTPVDATAALLEPVHSLLAGVVPPSSDDGGSSGVSSLLGLIPDKSDKRAGMTPSTLSSHHSPVPNASSDVMGLITDAYSTSTTAPQQSLLVDSTRIWGGSSAAAGGNASKKSSTLSAFRFRETGDLNGGGDMDGRSVGSSGMEDWGSGMGGAGGMGSIW
mmetsp:Transcript_31094/g.37959  ORF Transcript_31094/g.37959 Transcript_31094/m.37959 type:complete len:1506 (-) Transcript_31094:75-4592(-)